MPSRPLQVARSLVVYKARYRADLRYTDGPKPAELIRNTIEARVLARALDDQITDYSFELSLKEAVRNVSPKDAASVGLLDTGWRRRMSYPCATEMLTESSAGSTGGQNHTAKKDTAWIKVRNPT